MALTINAITVATKASRSRNIIGDENALKKAIYDLQVGQALPITFYKEYTDKEAHDIEVYSTILDRDDVDEKDAITIKLAMNAIESTKAAREIEERDDSYAMVNGKVYNVMKNNPKRYETTRLQLVKGKVDANGKVDHSYPMLTVSHIDEPRKPRNKVMVEKTDSKVDATDVDSIVAKYGVEIEN